MHLIQGRGANYLEIKCFFRTELEVISALEKVISVQFVKEINRVYSKY
jgi:hypothetical protein